MILEELRNSRSIWLGSHCDDEFLFGFPFIHHVKTILSCTDDKTHPTRQWCIRRSEAFREIGKLVGAETICLRHDSGFAKKEHKELVAFVREVQEIIKGFDIVCVDNAWGSYGHLDHILLHQIARMSGKRVVTTDICMQADWYPVAPYRQGKELEYCLNDLNFHEKCMAIYRSFKAMGWTYPPVSGASIIEVG